MCLARPAEIKSIDKSHAVVDFGGVSRKISLGILTGVKKGDHVLVHAGFAIGKVEKKEAASIRKALSELKEVIDEDITSRYAK